VEVRICRWVSELSSTHLDYSDKTREDAYLFVTPDIYNRKMIQEYTAIMDILGKLGSSILMSFT